MGHVIIAGAGRAGTTMLVRLLTRLGYDTGFKGDEWYDPETRAGCEITAGKEFRGNAEEMRRQFARCPQILKSPDWSWHLKPFLAAGLIEVDHVLIPHRESVDAARSRLNVGLGWQEAEDVDSQAFVHLAAVGACIEACTLFDVPYTVMRFPDLVLDWNYCLERLAGALPDINRDRFENVFRELNGVCSGSQVDRLIGGTENGRAGDQGSSRDSLAHC